MKVDFASIMSIKDAMSKLIYWATPARLQPKKKEIMDFVSEQGYGPFHQFQAFEYDRFEGGKIGREKTLEFCERAVAMCDEFWLFGISPGTLRELIYAQNCQKPIKVFIDNFDPEWKQNYKMLKAEYNNPLDIDQ